MRHRPEARQAHYRGAMARVQLAGLFRERMFRRLLAVRVVGQFQDGVIQSALAGFVQSLAAWFLAEQPFVPAEDDYLVYTYNRFQACRFGLDAVYVDPATGEHMPLRDHLLHTLDRIAPHGERHGAAGALHLLRGEIEANCNDARWLRERQREEQLLAEVSRQAALRFRGQA